MNVLVFGDVHGCVDELEKVLDSVDLNKLDLVVFAGDMLDKGPDPIGAIRMARRLSEEIPVVLVEGNHEERHRRWRKHMSEGRGKTAMSMSRSDLYYNTTAELCGDDLEFLDSAVLYFELPEHDALVVHGGIPPLMDQLPPSDMDEVLKLKGKKKRIAQEMQMVRYVSPDGKFVQKDKERKKDSFWADVYDGRFGTVLFGHTPHKDEDLPVGFSHAIGLDLSCATGNKLAAAILRPGEPAEFVVAPAARAYVKNPDEDMEIIVLPDTSAPGIWIGYVQEGDRMIPFSEGASKEDALADAELMWHPDFIDSARSRYELSLLLKKRPHPFVAPAYGGDGHTVLVHKSTRRRGWWQATFFEGNEPISDTDSSTWKELLEELGRFYSVDWKKAEKPEL